MEAPHSDIVRSKKRARNSVDERSHDITAEAPPRALRRRSKQVSYTFKAAELDSSEEDNNSPSSILTRVYPEGPPNPLPGKSPLIDNSQWKAKLCLDWTEHQVTGYLANLPVLTCTRLTKEESDLITPEYHWIAESEEVLGTWREYFETRIPHDTRSAPRNDVHLAKLDSWRRIISRQESFIVKDITDPDPNRHFIAGVVLREFLPDQEVLRKMQEVALRVIDLGRDIRLDDNGIMVQHAYTGASRGRDTLSAPGNIRHPHDPEVLRLRQHDTTSIQALLWNVCRKKLPPSIIQDFEKAMMGLPRHDWNLKGSSGRNTPNISIKAGEVDLEFTTGPSGLELGPPSGLCGSQYSKYCHSDKNHPLCHWVLSLTTERTAGPERGGSFFLADYGIKVDNCTNTFIAHRSDSLHETTLHDVAHGCIDPAELASDCVHSGFSMYVDSNLKKAYENFLKFGGPRTQAQKVDDEDEDYSLVNYVVQSWSEKRCPLRGLVIALSDTKKAVETIASLLAFKLKTGIGIKLGDRC